MFNFILMIMGMINSFIFTQMVHPLATGLLLLAQTLLICLYTGLMTHTFWFSYILFLVFLGGLLVLFIYVTSLASNEMFTLSPFLTLLALTTLLTTLIIMFILDPFSLTLKIENSETLLILPQQESIHSLLKLYNHPTGIITMTLILYLFLTLIAIVKITKIHHGPLRSNH